MYDIEIFYLDKSDLAEYESSARGYRNDVFAKVRDNYFKLVVYSILRLTQDFETEIDYSGYYAIDPNLVLVKEVSTAQINYFTII